MRMLVTEVLIFNFFFIFFLLWQSLKWREFLCLPVWGEHSRETLSYWAICEAHLEMHGHAFLQRAVKSKGGQRKHIWKNSLSIIPPWGSWHQPSWADSGFWALLAGLQQEHPADHPLPSECSSRCLVLCMGSSIKHFGASVLTLTTVLCLHQEEAVAAEKRLQRPVL